MKQNKWFHVVKDFEPNQQRAKFSYSTSWTPRLETRNSRIIRLGWEVERLKERLTTEYET